jgi:hypothetical protein
LAVDQGLPKVDHLKVAEQPRRTFLFLASHLDNGNNNNYRFERRQENERARTCATTTMTAPQNNRGSVPP